MVKNILNIDSDVLLRLFEEKVVGNDNISHNKVFKMQFQENIMILKKEINYMLF